MAERHQVAVLVEPGRIELEDRIVPAPDRGEIVLRVIAATTCGTDLKMYRRGHPLFPCPTPLGHEFSGIVHAVGEGVTRFAPGDAVMAVHSAPCLECRACRRGHENLCETLVDRMVLGSYSEFVRLPAELVAQNVYHKPAELSFAEASLLEPMACIAYGRRLLNLAAPAAADEPPLVLVYGAGPIGLLWVRVLQKEGVRVVTVARRQIQRDRALESGAYLAVSPDEAREAVRAASVTGEDLADAAIDCTGAASVWESCVDLVERGGEVLLYGGAPGGASVTLSTRRLHYDQLHLHGVFHFDPAAVRTAREWILTGNLRLEEMITRRAPLAQVADVFAEMDYNGSGVKNVIEPSAASSSAGESRAAYRDGA